MAEALCAALEAAGITCWIAPRDIPGGSYWAAEIAKVIPSTCVILLLISARINDSPNVQSELSLAHQHRRAILPVRLEATQLDATIEYFVSTLQWLDIFPDHQQKLSRVSSAIQNILTKSPGSTAALPPPKSAHSLWGPLLKGVLLLLLGALGGIAWTRLVPVPQPTQPSSITPAKAPLASAPEAPVAPAAPPDTVATLSSSTVPPPATSVQVPSEVPPTSTVVTPNASPPVAAPPVAKSAPPAPSEAHAQSAKPAAAATEKIRPVIPPHIDKDKGIIYTLKTWERQGTLVTFWLTVTSQHRDQFIQLGLNSRMLAPSDETWQSPTLVKDGQEQLFDYNKVDLLEGIPVRLGIRFRGIPPEVKIIKTLRLNLSTSTSLTPIIFSDLPLD